MSEIPSESLVFTPEPDPRADLRRLRVSSPIGSLGIEFRGPRVTYLCIQPSAAEFATFKPLKDVEGSDSLDEALGRLLEYLAGARQNPDLDFDLDAFEVSAPAQRILQETAKIPFGTTRSYQEVAAAVGQPDSYRLVRSTLVANPIPIVIPCHRVVPRKGGAGSYVGSVETKKWLMRLEQDWPRTPEPGWTKDT